MALFDHSHHRFALRLQTLLGGGKGFCSTFERDVQRLRHMRGGFVHLVCSNGTDVVQMGDALCELLGGTSGDIIGFRGEEILLTLAAADSAP